MCLVYCNSEHYNTTARVIILLQVGLRNNNNNILAFVPSNNLQMNVNFAHNMYLDQEICNLLIDMARKFLDPSSIFQIEVS